MFVYRSTQTCVHLRTILFLAVGAVFWTIESAAAQEFRPVQNLIREAVQRKVAPAKPPSASPETSDAAVSADPLEEGEASTEEAESPEAKSRKKVDRLLTRYERARKCILNLQKKPYQPEVHDGRALLVMDTIEYNVMPGGPSNGNRHLIAQLHLVNLTDKPVTIRRESVRLKLPDEAPLKQSEVSEKIQNYSFDTGNGQTKSFSDVKRPEQQTVQPGSSGSMWIFFADLELGASMPDAEIQVELEGQPRSLDLKTQVCGQFFVTRTDIGPEQSLALIEIGGRFNRAASTLR